MAKPYIASPSQLRVLSSPLLILTRSHSPAFVVVLLLVTPSLSDADNDDTNAGE